MDKKIIFFDIDGTILSNEIGYVREGVKKAIKQVQSLGHYCFIASGRPWGYIANEIRNIGFDGYVLGNGSHVIFHDRDISIRYLNYQYLKNMIQIFDHNQIEYVLVSSTYCYMNDSCESLINFYRHCHIDFENLCFQDVGDEVIKKTIKVEVWVKDKKQLQVVKDASKYFICEVHPDLHSVEIYAKDVSKATGIYDILKAFNIPIEHSYCFGDGPNDIEMFEAVGHPIAMDNAIGKIKDKVEIICESVNNDGVAKQLGKIFLKNHFE